MTRLIQTVILVCILGVLVNGQAVEQKYDRFQDQTTISIVLGKTAMDQNYNSMSLHLETSFTGKKVPTEPVIRMSILLSAREWKLLGRDLTLRAIIDGERVTVGEFKRNYSEVIRGAIIEGAVMIFPLETLKKIVAAKSVEMQFLGTEMSATQTELDRMKKFIAALEVP